MKTKPESQSKEILKYMQGGGRITPLLALTLFGCFRLSARIFELRGKNKIFSKMHKVGNGKSVKMYWMKKYLLILFMLLPGALSYSQVNGLFVDSLKLCNIDVKYIEIRRVIVYSDLIHYYFTLDIGQKAKPIIKPNGTKSKGQVYRNMNVCYLKNGKFDLAGFDSALSLINIMAEYNYRVINVYTDVGSAQMNVYIMEKKE